MYPVIDKRILAIEFGFGNGMIKVESADSNSDESTHAINLCFYSDLVILYNT